MSQCYGHYPDKEELMSNAIQHTVIGSTLLALSFVPGINCVAAPFWAIHTAMLPCALMHTNEPPI